jgi:ligand-binding SRPBCC domain-containing protein
MLNFNYTFTVDASHTDVAAFHRDTSALKKLSPPPMIVQLHRVDPMGEGSISEFTLWLGPIPVRWRAVHSKVSEHGFTDTQESGPLEFWAHTHRFEAINKSQTRIHEHIEYRHPKGWRRIFTRLIFSKLGLQFLFTYRQLATKRALRSKK